MSTWRTSNCSQHGHREITLVVGDDVPIPNLANPLLRHFEEEVARGTQFLPGQTVQYGWSRLRLCEREDGTLGLEELELTQEVSWTESVARALKDNWFQVQVVGSVGLIDQLAFPRHDDGVMVQTCAGEGEEMTFHRLPAAECPEGFSGWSLRCGANHPHEEQQLLPLMAVAAVQPGLVQFFALPHETAVLVRWRTTPEAPDRLVIEPHILRGGNEIAPAADSYLAGLRSL